MARSTRECRPVTRWRLAAVILAGGWALSSLPAVTEASVANPLVKKRFGFVVKDDLLNCPAGDRVALASGPSSGTLAMRWDVRAAAGQSRACRRPFNQRTYAGAERFRFKARSAASGKLVVRLIEEDGETFLATVNTSTKWQSFTLPVASFRLDDSTRRNGEVDVEQLAKIEVIDAQSASGPAGTRTHWLSEWFIDTWPSPVVRTSNLGLSSRPFRLGLVQWPVVGFPDPGPAATSSNDAFLAAHADVTLHHLETSIPWADALANKPLPAGLSDHLTNIAARTPANHRVLLAVTPLDSSRTRLAASWGGTGLPLPASWNSYPLNHPNVKIAYLNYVRQVVERLKPDYLCIGIEVNLLLTNNGGNIPAWEQYQDLHRHVYTALKRSYPNLPIFASVLLAPLRASIGTPFEQFFKTEVGQLLSYSDWLGVSAHPFGEPGPVPDNYFDVAVSFGKPIAVTETSFPSRRFTAFSHDFQFSPLDQYRYVELLLRKAHQHRFRIVTYVPPVDYDDLLSRMTWDMAPFWAHNGFRESDGEEKPVLDLWDAYLALPKQ